MFRHLLAESTFAESCEMEIHFPPVLVESAMSCAKSKYCDLGISNLMIFGNFHKIKNAGNGLAKDHRRSVTVLAQENGHCRPYMQGIAVFNIWYTSPCKAELRLHRGTRSFSEG
jgi:hypothetical protein